MIPNNEKWTDKELARLEARIVKVFDEAKLDIDDTYYKYVHGWDETVPDEKNGGTKVIHHDGLEERYAKEFKAYQEGKYHDETGKYTDEEMFNRWWHAQEGRGEHIKDLYDQIDSRLTQASQIATDYTNDKLPKVWVTNNNYVKELAQESAMKQGLMGVRFDLANEQAVRRLMMGSREVRPYKPIELDLPKYSKYNRTKLQNALLQGILQGDSVYKIADRFQAVCNMDRSIAIRNARTAFTGAQNAGLMQGYEDLADEGCIVYKMWMATNDDRTREEHTQAEDDYGTEANAIPWDEPFEVGGEELMYPADPSGSGWNIYNCRCTMHTVIKFKSNLSDKQRKGIKVLG